MTARNPNSSDTAGAARTGGRRRFSLRPLRERGGSVRTPKPPNTRPGRESSEETATVPVEQAAETAPRLPAWLRRLGYYGLALLFVAVAALLRWGLSDALKPTPALVFYLAWVGAAAFGGFGPGLLATLASWFCIDLLFDTTPGQIGLTDPASLGRLMVLLAGGFVVSVVGEMMRRSRIREHRQGQELRKREQALRVSEAALTRAQALAHLASWEVDVGTNRVRGSRELYRFFGLEPDAALDAYVEKFHPDDRGRVVESIEAAIYQGQPYSIDYRIVPRPGEVRHVHAEGEVIRDKNGAPLTFFGTVQDITERKQAEEALRESEERLHLALEAARMGVWQWEVGTERVAWSPELYALLGYELGQVTPTHQAFRQRIHPQDLARWEQAMRGSMERCEDYSCEFRVVWPDGSVHWVEARGQYDYTRGEAGAETVWMRGVLTDVDRRKQAEKALRESEERLRLAQQVAHIGTFEWNIQTGVNTWTPELEAMYGLPPGGFPGTQEAWEQLVHPEDRTEAVRRVNEAMVAGGFEGEWRVVWPDGSVHWLYGRAYVFKDESGAPLKLTGVNIDVTARKQAEEALRESEEKHRRIVETATEGIAMADAEARLIFVNDRWSEIFGYSPEEAAHITLFDLVFPEDVARVKERWESRKRGQKERYEWRYRRKDGRPIWVLASVAPRFGPAGEFLGTLVLNTDITERKQGEEALRENETRLRVALDAGRMGTWVWDLATDTVDTDPLHRHLWELDDTDVRVPARVILEKIHPADRARVFGRESAQQMAREPFDIEFRVVRRDGSTRWLQGSAVPIRDADGVLQKVIGVNFDITERKQAEEALRESEERLRFVVENSPDTILIQDRDLRYVWIIHPAYPLTHEQLLGHTDREMLLPEDAAPLTEIKQRVLAEGQRLTVEVPMTWEGQKRLYEATYEPWRDAAGAIIGVAGYVRDITERKRVEESLRELTATLETRVAQRTEELEQRARQLQKLTLELSEAEERERGRIAEILHDDLQQVLAAAKFHLSRVGSGTISTEQSQGIVEQVKQMLKDAIEKSRNLSHELSPAVLRHGDLAETLEWLAEQMQAKHGLTVRVEAFGAVKTQSDVVNALVYRSAQELLFNVVKHAQVGEARIRIRRLGRYICLSVADRGRGFDPQEVKQTTGFGLLNIRERVALLGGRTKVRSARGRGTTFHLIVPDAASAANGAPVAAETTERTATDPRL